jgi:hypothetical protein
MLERKEVDAALQKFGKYVIQQSRSILTRTDSNASKRLYNSLKYEAKANQQSIELSFEMEDYGKFQDLGVRGASSSAKAPNSPYRFGSGTGRPGGLTEGVFSWITNYRRFQFRDKQTGRFLSYEQTAFLVARSIYQKGIEPKRFFTQPFERAFVRLPEEVVEAYGLEVEGFLKFTVNDTN